MNERDGKFAEALGKAWNYIKSDGSFTGRELKEWTNQMDFELCQQVLRSVIQTAWVDYGGKEMNNSYHCKFCGEDVEPVRKDGTTICPNCDVEVLPVAELDNGIYDQYPWVSWKSATGVRGNDKKI